MKHRVLCACGNVAVKMKHCEPVCQRCLALETDEAMDWIHKPLVGVRRKMWFEEVEMPHSMRFTMRVEF